jgi:hypothetical protein
MPHRTRPRPHLRSSRPFMALPSMPLTLHSALLSSPSIPDPFSEGASHTTYIRIQRQTQLSLKPANESKITTTRKTANNSPRNEQHQRNNNTFLREFAPINRTIALVGIETFKGTAKFAAFFRQGTIAFLAFCLPKVDVKSSSLLLILPRPTPLPLRAQQSAYALSPTHPHTPPRPIPARRKKEPQVAAESRCACSAFRSCSPANALQLLPLRIAHCRRLQQHHFPISRSI